MANNLVMYKRHNSTCVKGYDKDYRLLRPRTPEEVKADCQCTIAVSGSLRLEKQRIRHLSTEINNWELADQTVQRWLKWGALTDPNPPAASDTPKLLEESITDFLEWKGPGGENLEPGTMKLWNNFFKHRIRPFLAARNIQFLAALNDTPTLRKCVTGWRKLIPATTKGGTPTVTDEPLGQRTKAVELDRLNVFLNFCVDSRWITENAAKKIELDGEEGEARFGLEEDEEARVWRYLDPNTLPKRSTSIRLMKRMRLYVINRVLRHAGLRISDATKLNHTQLVPRESGSGYAIQVIRMLKTKRIVRIPIPDDVANELLNLPFCGERDGLKYWFWPNAQTYENARAGWQKDITKMFQRVQRETNVQFRHRASPHTWRHTFAIRHLNGTDIFFVSRWLGHTGIQITQDAYGHAIKSTQIASENAHDESVRRQRERAEGRRPSL